MRVYNVTNKEQLKDVQLRFADDGLCKMWYSNRIRVADR